MRENWFKNRNNAMKWLLKNFSKSIGTNQPLKVGIFNDIKSFESTDKPSLIWCRRAMRLHTNCKKYLLNLREDANRVDLNGEPQGKVTSDEVENAKQKILTLIRKFKQEQRLAKKIKNHKNSQEIKQQETNKETPSSRPILSSKKEKLKST